MAERAAPAPAFGILVGEKQAVVGFRYPSFGNDPGEGDNFVRASEVRVASHILAVLGEPGPNQWSSPSRSSVEHIAQLMTGYCVASIVVSPANPMPTTGRSTSRKPRRTDP